MDEHSLDSGKRCSWCGTLNSASDNACSKCGAVLPSIQHPVVSTSSEPEAGTPVNAEDPRATNQDAVRALVDGSLFDKISGQAMLSMGLGPRFESGQIRAYVTVGFLSIFLLLSLFAVRADSSQIELLSKAEAGKIITQPEIVGNFAAAILARLVLVAVVLFTAVAFLTWIYRAHQNLNALGAVDLQYSPGWAVGGFFVPMLNIVRPFQVVAEIWKASGPQATRSGGTAWKYAETPIFIGLWWGSWLLSGFLSSLSAFMVFGDVVGEDETDPFLAAARFRIVYDVVSAVCAVLAIVVVLKINERQESTNRLNLAAAQQQAEQPGIARDQL
jgi:uncharacterized protein DUF4328